MYSLPDNPWFHSAKKPQAKMKRMLPTCAPYPDVSVVPVRANLLLHGRARPSREAFSARTLSCELRKEKHQGDPALGTFLGRPSLHCS